MPFVVIPEKENATTDTTSHIQEQTTMREQSTLIPNEAEAFALEPIDVTNFGKFQTVLIHSIVCAILPYFIVIKPIV